MKVTVIRVVIKPYSNQDLAKLFNCCSRTIRRDIAPFKALLGERRGHRWSIAQVEIILEKLGRPYEIVEHDAARILELMPQIIPVQAA